jgi:AAA domain, putative AbiEii toxin, Type IV TA system/AAA domain
MLNDLLISGFRALKRLEIEKLGRVNLITGKNNSGKSSLLEALRIYAGRSPAAVFSEVLGSRDEYAQTERPPQPKLTNAASVLTLFHGRKTLEDLEERPRIEIGPRQSGDDRLLMEAAWYGVHPDHRGVSQYVELDEDAQFEARVPAIAMTIWNKKLVFPLDKDFSEWSPRMRRPTIIPKLPVPRYLGPYSLPFSSVAELWEEIALTEAEDTIVDCLRLIAPEVERVSVLPGGNGLERTPLVRVRGALRPIPLRSMGDGMSRLFGIALAMVNASDGWLLVDEIENGIHYSIQTQLWDFIVRLASRLNVQVFATTHSWDCITAFQQATHESESDGTLIRLAWKNGTVRAVEYTEDELAIATRQSIEVR